MKRLLAWLRGRRGDMVEGALTLPLMALLALGLVNLALAGFASNTAQNAAAYAARMAAVSQDDPTGRALAAAGQVLQNAVGDYTVNVSAESRPGGFVRVDVTWEVPNIFGSLLPYFGRSLDALSGTATVVQRKEGW